MKKVVVLFFIMLITLPVFSQTFVSEKKLKNALEKNTNENEIFVSDIDLSSISISETGTISLPLFSKSKVKIVSGMDMTGLSSRLSYSNLKKWTTTFEVKDLSTKTYSITNIEGIETVAQYTERNLEQLKIEARKNITRMPVQVVLPETINLSPDERIWIQSQIQDKLKSNLQDYLGMKTVVDSKSESMLKKLQAESENIARDESTSIELGKITTAKYALFGTIRKTNKGYIISIDFTDLTTGEQMASVTSNEYSKIEYLYCSTGAVDYLTLELGKRLDISISNLNQNLLTTGTSSLSLDDQFLLIKQNEEQFLKQMNKYDDELAKLKMSNDLSSIQQMQKLEAEKSLLAEKQKADQKRIEELNRQKEQYETDKKLELERSISLITQRDTLSQQATDKAKEIRIQVGTQQEILTKLITLESKKKALIDIRDLIENECLSLYRNLMESITIKENKINNTEWTTIELSDGKPSVAAIKRRNNQILDYKIQSYNDFINNCEELEKSIENQESLLLKSIYQDYADIAKTKTISNLGNELKVSFGNYNSDNKGWTVYFSLYSDNILVLSDSVVLSYEALTGMKAPNLETASDKEFNEYLLQTDLYNSLLSRGDPIVYFELDYNVEPNKKNNSSYDFNFKSIRIYNTVSNKVIQTINHNKKITYSMHPEYDIIKKPGIKNRVDTLVKLNSYGIEMKKVKNSNFCMLSTEVTQKTYLAIMGKNPSKIKGNNYPVTNISWIDCIEFCNKLSKLLGLEPAYIIIPDPRGSDYYPDFRINKTANGFRLPTRKEWLSVAVPLGKIIDQESLDDYAWYKGAGLHEVAQKRPDINGLFDIYGNVEEWGWVDDDTQWQPQFGGAYGWPAERVYTTKEFSFYYWDKADWDGFRIVCDTDTLY